MFSVLLFSIYKQILESDTHSALTSSSPTYQLPSDREPSIRKKSDDTFSASMTKYNNYVSPDPMRSGNRAIYAKSDDYDGIANRKELPTSSMSQLQQQQRLQPRRYVLLNYGSNHSRKPVKSSHGFTLNQPPPTATQYHNLHSLIKKPSSHAADTNDFNNNSDAMDENLDWINSSSSNNVDDYDFVYDGNIPKTFSKYRFRRNSNPIRQTMSWQRY